MAVTVKVLQSNWDDSIPREKFCGGLFKLFIVQNRPKQTRSRSENVQLCLFVCLLDCLYFVCVCVFVFVFVFVFCLFVCFGDEGRKGELLE